TQGMRQGNDIGTQYRSTIYWYGDAQRQLAEASRSRYQEVLRAAGHGEITTELAEAPPFYYAEEYHQQYLGKNPNGNCGLGGPGVSCPIGLKAGRRHQAERGLRAAPRRACSTQAPQATSPHARPAVGAHSNERPAVSRERAAWA